MSPRRTALLLLLCKVLLLQACAHRQVNEIAAALPAAGPERTLAELETLNPPDRDRAQYLLDRGLLKLYTGDFAGSREDLESAKQIMASLQAVSITENIAAATTNETLRSYDGTPSERALVHVIAALAYLLSGDLDGARVEMLQADVTMQELADGYSVSGQMASAHFMAGLVFELNDEPDEALISYRRAYRIMRERSEWIPEALQISLLNLTKRRDFPDEYADYVELFGREHALPNADEGEWILLYFDGVVSNKTEVRFPVFDPGAGTMVTVVVPEYPFAGRGSFSVNLQAGENSQRTGIVENIERRAREDLSAEMPAILAAATARAVGKFIAVKNAQEQNELVGAIATIMAIASEQADLRSWNMLPANIQVARVVAPLAETARISEKGIVLPAMQEMTDGRYVVVFATSLNGGVMTYPIYDSVETVAEPVNQYEYVEVVREAEAPADTGETQ